MLIDFEGNEFDLKPTKIIAVARNYRAHAAEMGSAAPEEPRFFLKPPSSLIGHKGVVIIPASSQRVDYEVELAVIIRDRLKKCTPEQAMKNLLGYAVLVDITARDIQNEAKKQGMPWAIAKGFDTFAPTGPRIVDANKLDPANLDLWLKVNGAVKQKGNTRDMIHAVDRLIASVSRVMTLEPHDIIATGTPEGIGPMKHGDHVEAGIDGIGILEFAVENDKQ
jgi:2-keto-4-pentenoate hydratase/2-oxohepta-3-ene-1,7-dioic acid hydratase in catechol pathway